MTSIAALTLDPNAGKIAPLVIGSIHLFGDFILNNDPLRPKFVFSNRICMY